MKVDYHMHSSFSNDCDYPMEEVIKEAIGKGLDEICFTEHVDYGPYYDLGALPPGLEEKLRRENKYNVNYPAYLDRLGELREKYKGKIKIKQGLEFGIQVSTIPDYEKLFKTYDLDFVISSCHQVDNKELWNQEYQQHLTQREFYLGYYNEILNVAKNFHNYSVLGHLDHHIRYDKKGFYESREVDEVIDEILRTVISDNKGIEVNTSGYAYDMNDFHPSTRILKRYYDLGGRIITIGSDSHTPGRVGDRFELARNTLKDIGFREFCTFTRMKPEFHPL